MRAILQNALEAHSYVDVADDAMEYLANMSNGDARTALNCLQIAIDSAQDSGKVDLKSIKESLKRSHVLYDRKGDEHFHCASALQKSIRGSNDNAALYWTMRMLEGGEDPMFIARRLVREAIVPFQIGKLSKTAISGADILRGCGSG